MFIEMDDFWARPRSTFQEYGKLKEVLNNVKKYICFFI